MRVFFAIVLIGMTPALAQGVVNRRDSSGNLPRDKGVSTPTVLPHALVGRLFADKVPEYQDRA